MFVPTCGYYTRIFMPLQGVVCCAVIAGRSSDRGGSLPLCNHQRPQFNSIQTRIVNLFSRSNVLCCHSRQEQKGEASIPLGFGRRAMLHPYWVQGDVQSALMDMPVHLEGALTQLSVVNLPQILRGAGQYPPCIP